MQQPFKNYTDRLGWYPHKHLLVSTLSAPTMQPVPDKLTKLFASGSYYEIPIAISLAGAQLQYTN